MTSRKFDSTSPQRPDTIIGSFLATSPDEVRAARDRARGAQREWWNCAPVARATALSACAQAITAHRGELADLVIAEVGKPRMEATGEVDRAAAIMRYFAQLALAPVGDHLPAPGPVGSVLLDTRRPRGVAGLITPWNFPLAIPLWKAAPALAAGNAILLKPAPEATATAARLAALLAAHLPDGLVSVLPGDAQTGAAVVTASDVLSFTGSTEVGRRIASAAVAAGVAVQTEMGGLNASVVLADADVTRAAATIASAAMGYAGQKCTATSRVIIVGENKDFTDALVAAVEALGTGDPDVSTTVVGPVISAQARTAVIDAAASAHLDGARVLTGGTAGDPGWFVSPTLVDGLGEQAALHHDEVFGPIASLQYAASTEDAVRLVNSTRYGLVTGLFTRDLDQALELVPQLETGMVKVNGPTTGADFHASFGGEKDSGYGPAEQGRHVLDFYSRHHTVSLSPSSA